MNTTSDQSADNDLARAGKNNSDLSFPGISSASEKLYRSKWNVWRRYCRNQGVDPMDATSQHLNKFLEALCDEQNSLVPTITSASTLQGYWAAIKAVYESCDQLSLIQGKPLYRFWALNKKLKDQPTGPRRNPLISGSRLRHWDESNWQRRHGTAFPLTATRESDPIVSPLPQDPKFLRDRAIVRTAAFSSLSIRTLARLHITNWDIAKIEVTCSQKPDDPIRFTHPQIVDALTAWLLTSDGESRPLFCKLNRSGALISEPLSSGSLANIVKDFTGYSLTELRKGTKNCSNLIKLKELIS